MLVVNRFVVGDESAFVPRAEAALAALAGPARLRVRRLRAGSVDEPERWCLVTRWESVGAYRRALSAFEVKVEATPLLAESLDEPSAYEVLLEAGPGGPVRAASSDRAAAATAPRAARTTIATMTFHPAGGVGIDPGVPAPPPGPGAAPPFAAPPTDKNKRGLWIGLGVGGLVLLLCCVGGIFGVGVLYVNATRAGQEPGQRDRHPVPRRGARRRLPRRPLALLRKPRDRGQHGRPGPAGPRRGVTSYRLDEPVFAAYLEVRAHLSTASGEVTRMYQSTTVGQPGSAHPIDIGCPQRA